MGMLRETMRGMKDDGAQPAEQNGMGVDELVKLATKLLYGDNFESMVNMFQKQGKEGFPQAMAMAINGVLDRLEKEQGQPLTPELAAEVGGELFEILLADLSEGGVLPDIDKQDVLGAIEAILQMWSKQHRDQVDPEEMKGIIQAMAQELTAQGQLQPGEQVTTPSENAAMAKQQGPGQPMPPQEQPPQGQPPQGV